MGRSRGKATLHDKNVFYSQKEGFEPILIPYSHHLFYLRCNPPLCAMFSGCCFLFLQPGKELSADRPHLPDQTTICV